MGKSLIQVVNPASQTITAGVGSGTIGLGTTIRRYGCNCKQNGNAIEINGPGYYKVDATITLTPAEVGNVAIALYVNGVQVPGTLVGSSVSTVGNSTTLPIVATLRQGCYCDGADSVTLVLVSGDSTVTNVSLRVEKD